MCKNKVVVGARWSDGTTIEVACGEYYGGEKVLCEGCEAEYRKRYPQGWVAYPGDVCPHGRYVGGCGADRMCVYCELGE